MFLKIICFYGAVACVSAAPPTDVVPLGKQQPTVIPIVAQSEELEANGTFKFSYETANGIKREETSYDKVLPKAKSGASSNEAGEDKSDESNEIHVQQGSYSYTAPDGTVITVRYIADENGFRPIGDHLPKPPSIQPAASPARISGSKAKTADNAEDGSAPVAVIASAPAKETSEAPTPIEASKSPNTPKVASRIAKLSSAEQTSTPASEEAQDSSTTPVVPLTTEVSTTAEPATSTTESASTTTEQSFSSEVTSTEQPTTSEASSTPEPSSEPSTPEEPASTLAVSTSDATPASSTSDVTLATSTPDVTPAASTSDAAPPTSTSDATPAESTQSSNATTEAATTASA